MKSEKSVQISMYLLNDEYARLEAISTEQRRSASATMRLLFEDAINGDITPDLTKRVKQKEAKRANMIVDHALKARIEALKASSEGLSMSEIMMRLIEAYEAKREAGKGE